MIVRRPSSTRKVPLLFILLALFALGPARPRPARADDYTAVIVVSAIAGYVLFIVGGTWLVYTRKNASQQPLLESSRLPETDGATSERLRLAPHCRTADGSMPLVCW